MSLITENAKEDNMELTVIILISTAMAFAGARMAESKNRPTWLGAALGFGLGLLGLLIVYCLPAKRAAVDAVEPAAG
jgi:hypothetical protein